MTGLNNHQFGQASSTSSPRPCRAFADQWTHQESTMCVHSCTRGILNVTSLWDRSMQRGSWTSTSTYSHTVMPSIMACLTAAGVVAVVTIWVYTFQIVRLQGYRVRWRSRSISWLLLRDGRYLVSDGITARKNIISLRNTQEPCISCALQHGIARAENSYLAVSATTSLDLSIWIVGQRYRVCSWQSLCLGMQIMRLSSDIQLPRRHRSSVTTQASGLSKGHS